MGQLKDPISIKYKEEMNSQNISGIWEEPILGVGDKLLGVLSIFSPQPQKETESNIKIIKSAAQVLSLSLEHSRTQEFLNKTVSLLNATVESTADGILVIDNEGKIVSLNRKFLKIWNIPQEIISSGQDKKALEHAIRQLRDPEKFLAKVEELYRTPEAESFDFLEFKDGRCIERYSQPQKLDGVTIGRVWSFRDVTDRFRAEIAAKAADQARIHFLANVSHEIRTPLGAIMGFSEMLSTPFLKADETQSIVGKIKANGEHLLKIIEEILDSSKLEFGRFDMDRSNVDLCSLLVDTQNVLLNKIQQKGIEFSLEVEGELPRMICTDSRRLKQILLNLLDNSIKFTESGKVSLRVSRVEKNFFKFTVKDTGIGISKEQAEKLFIPFSQVDSSYSRRHKGTGLGLALARQLAQMLGGDVVLTESAIGIGSTFTATIAAEIPEGEPQVFFNKIGNFVEGNEKIDKKTQEQSSGTSLQGVSLLLVDDTYDNQLIIKHFLKNLGVQIDTAADGREGVDKASRRNYDIILMDIQMPQMDGYQAVSLLRNKGYAGTVISLTAHAGEQERVKAMEAGFNDFLTKPVSRQTLINTISQHLKRT